MASINTELLPYRPNAHEPLTLADLVAMCATCNTQVELWWMLEPHVTAHMWDENDILVIWHDVRASIAQEASQRRLLQETEQQATRPKRKVGQAWATTGWKKFRGVLRRMKKASEE